ncbi:hypothetical protein [Aeromicrobium chenweiae]|uniref:Uncharacterized protein n=1 Tax=Aeromicrobium chenweiae TaxID=2079793 RepID=A0A2S0WPE2_9ACTN|nr:hypothetical protein [Aeromicrobium chenweiae]AWB93114.1 hypothetical protein C3E78_13345 [Aeromicrobium chenweiae]TGN34102.1 hypothetical protein E4L97_03380 [Aeromicrobium chenweiae]
MTIATSTHDIATALRKLYFVRFGFAIIWAALILSVGSDIDPLTGTLLVLYPLFDVGAAIVDLRASRATRPAAGLYLNIALSTATAIGLGFAAASGEPAVLRVWGAWAITAGIVQLIVAVNRRRLGGQVPQILSGGISVLAGGSFVAAASADDPSLTNIGGYAVLGGIFFLVSALRLNRTTGVEQDA